MILRLGRRRIATRVDSAIPHPEEDGLVGVSQAFMQSAFDFAAHPLQRGEEQQPALLNLSTA